MCKPKSRTSEPWSASSGRPSPSVRAAGVLTVRSLSPCRERDWVVPQRERDRRSENGIHAAKRPPIQIPGGLPARRAPDFRELASLNQINQHVPLVVGEDREIPFLTDPDLFSRELHFRARAAPKGAQQHFPVVQCIHLLPFTICSRSM